MSKEEGEGEGEGEGASVDIVVDIDNDLDIDIDQTAALQELANVAASSTFLLGTGYTQYFADL